MALLSAGDLDRRIQVFKAARSKDGAGDTIFDWEHPELKFDRWAKKSDAYGREIKSAQQLVRDVDTVWSLRWDSQSRSISPEAYRFMHKGTVYEIVSVSEGSDGRMDRINFLCASRPDLEGDRGRETGSEQP